MMRRQHGWRAALALSLNLVALVFATAAVCTSYWCEGTRKVAKPFCTGPPLKVKQSFCIRFNSSNVNDSRLVQYIFETGEEKFLLRRFHTGIFFSCEQAADMNGKSQPAGIEEGSSGPGRGPEEPLEPLELPGASRSFQEPPEVPGESRNLQRPPEPLEVEGTSSSLTFV